VNCAVPKKSAWGVKSTVSSLGSPGVPPSWTTAVPCVALTMTIQSGFPSALASLASTSTLTATSSSVMAASSTATGGS